MLFEVGQRREIRDVEVQSLQAVSSVGKNLWRPCTTYGWLIGCPMLKPHDLRHGVAMDVLEEHHDLEAVRALLGHTRLETTRRYARIRPAALKHAVESYEAKTLNALSS